MDTVLISTTDLAAGRSEVCDRMLRSLVETEGAMGRNRMILALLLQNCPPDRLPEIASALPSFVRPLAVAGRVPLSVARNLMLRQLAATGAISADTLVAFPDDDCWYPQGFLPQVAALFAREATLDFWFCRYASHPVPKSFVGGAPLTARTREVVRNASSNTIFIRGRVVTAIGEFDEALGVGTPMGGAEDLDYALRARRVARVSAYHDAVLVGHRDKSPEFIARYYGSGLFVLARYARYGAASAFIRKIAVGAYLLLHRQLTLGDMTAALRRAMAECRSPTGHASRLLKVGH